MRTSFTDLLAKNIIDMDDNWGQSNFKTNQVAHEIPKFKSFQPSSLPISPSPVSPSSYFAASPAGFSPTDFLNSSFFLASPTIHASPAAGALAVDQSFNWRSNSDENQIQNKKQTKEEEPDYYDFSFQTHTKSASNFESCSNFFQGQQQPVEKQETWKFNEQTKQADVSAQTLGTKSNNLPFGTSCTQSNMENSNPAPQSGFGYTQSAHSIREQKRSEDGFNWRKYGQKQVKGSENPRSYYKCTYPGCAMKKKVERSLEGHVTEIVYKGSHNHPKPQPNRRTSSHPSSSCTNSCISDQSVATLGNMKMEVTLQEDSSVSLCEEDRKSQTSNSIDYDEEFEPDAKRWKGDENESYSTAGSRTVREPRVVVQTTSEIDILDDGYRWRKYGQKVVKGNPNARSYYKCTYAGCSVRKHVERAANDLRSVITSYEGKHNHDVPAARGSVGYAANKASFIDNTSNAIMPIRPSAMTSYSCQSSFTNSLNHTREPISSSQESAHLEVLQNPGNFGYSNFRRLIDSYVDQ